MAISNGPKVVSRDLVVSIDPENPKTLPGDMMPNYTSVGTTYETVTINSSSPVSSTSYTGMTFGMNIPADAIPINSFVVFEYEIIANDAKDSSGNDLKLGAIRGTQFGPGDMINTTTEFELPLTKGVHRYSFIADGEYWNASASRNRMYMSTNGIVASGSIVFGFRKYYVGPIVNNMAGSVKNKDGVKVKNISMNNGVRPAGDKKNLYFDGVNDFLYYNTPISYGEFDPWSTEMWVRFPPTASESWHGLWGTDLGLGGYWMFHSAGSMTWYNAYVDSIARIYYHGEIDLTNTIPHNKWTHLAWTYDGQGETTGAFRMYQDGVLKKTHVPGAFYTTQKYSGGLKFIGAGPGRYGEHDMGIFRHYNTKLEESEIRQNYEATRSKYGV